MPGDIIAEISSEYNHVHKLSDTLYAVVGKDKKYYKKYGVLSVETGAFVLPLEYDRMSYFHGSFLRVWSKGRDEDGNGKHGIFSIEEQELVLPVDYDAIEWLSDTLFEVRKGEKYGVFSIEEQELVLPVDYDYVSRWGEYICVVEKEGKRGAFSTITNEVTWKNKNE